MVLKVRETLIAQRTTLINTVRGHASEFGIIAGKGVGKIDWEWDHAPSIGR
jgi:transposase